LARTIATIKPPENDSSKEIKATNKSTRIEKQTSLTFSPPPPSAMKLPYVIDNQTHILADILKSLLTEHKGRSLDVATAYFTVGGFGLVRDGLMDVGNFRLLLGAEPRTGEQIGLRPDAGVESRAVRRELAMEHGEDELPIPRRGSFVVDIAVG
jgi:hypothetical protein